MEQKGNQVDQVWGMAANDHAWLCPICIGQEALHGETNV